MPDPGVQGRVTVSVSSFLASYPEFRPAHEQHAGLISALLAKAELVVGDHWETERDEVVELELASRLAAGPMGRAAQLIDKDGESTYSRQLHERQIAHAYALGRLG
ncbi:MAG: hypothetical protein WC683_06275 [bacterium]